MNPMYTQIVGSVVRFLLAGVSTYLVERGVVNQDEMTFLVAGIVTGLVTLGLSIWQKYGAQLKLVTALALPPMSEERLEAAIANPSITVPSVTTPKDVRPTTGPGGPPPAP